MARFEADSWTRWDGVLGTTVTTPPIEVYLMMHVLVDQHEVISGHAFMEVVAGATTWSNWVVADAVLAHTKIEYDAADYDSAAERGTTAKCQVTESWARPLAHVTSVGLLGVGPLTGFRKNRFAAGDLALTFSDGFEAAIPGQPTASGADLEPSERFFEAVRSAISF